MQSVLSDTGVNFRKCSKCCALREWNGGRGWNKRQCPECWREYQRQYQCQRYAANPEAARERKRQYRAAHPEAERERERSRQRRAANPEAARERERQRYAANPEGKRKHRRIRRARKLNAVCQHGPGCFDQAIATLPQRCAVPGCRRRQRLEADHIIPLAKGGLDCRDNLQLLCKSHNASKNATDPIVWARRNGRLL